jgi:hypothetical protein
MPKSRRPYSLEYRQRIIELVRGGRSAESLAREDRKTGRRGLTPQQVLRSLILARVKNWAVRQASHARDSADDADRTPPPAGADLGIVFPDGSDDRVLDSSRRHGTGAFTRFLSAAAHTCGGYSRNARPSALRGGLF